MLKDDLVDALQERLEKNENIYAKSSTFSGFYERYGSPIKRERSSPAEDIVKPTRRRQTITAQVTDARRSSNSLLPDSYVLSTRRVKLRAATDITAVTAQHPRNHL